MRRKRIDLVDHMFNQFQLLMPSYSLEVHCQCLSVEKQHGPFEVYTVPVLHSGNFDNSHFLVELHLVWTLFDPFQYESIYFLFVLHLDLKQILAPRKNDENQNEEWTTKSPIMLPNYLLDHIDLLRQNQKRMYESCTIHESYPALEKTETNDQPRSSSLQEKFSSRMTASQCRCMKIRMDVFVIMQSAKRTGIFRQQCLPSRLLGEQFQLQNNQLPIRMLGFHRVRRQLI